MAPRTDRSFAPLVHVRPDGWQCRSRAVSAGPRRAHLRPAAGLHDGYRPATTAYGPATTAYGPATTAYGPATTAYGPATTAYGPALSLSPAKRDLPVTGVPAAADTADRPMRREPS